MAAAPFARVAVVRPVTRLLHYRIPSHLAPSVQPGVRCAVPLGRTRCVGFVIAAEAQAEVPQVRELLDVLDPQPCLPQDLIELGLWLAAYYHHPPGETLAALLPPRHRAAATPVYCPGSNAQPPTAADARRLWDEVTSCGELDGRRVGAGQFRTLRDLLASGHVSRQWRVAKPPPLRAPLIYVPTDRCPAADALPARAKRQAQVVEALQQGPLPARVLREQGIPAATLRQMEQRGWLGRLQAASSGVDPHTLSLATEASRPVLTTEQTAALDRIEEGGRSGRFFPLLLQGITGSGKTEVYLRAAQAARDRGQGVLVLVPEIGLTPQILGRFLAVFGDQVAILHSALGEAERCRQWDRIRCGEAMVVLGVRSAVFAPVRDLGLIVVDEEHEASYKQDDGLRYHAKHVALMRGQRCNSLVLLGSATPDLETVWNVQQGRYQQARLTHRVGAARPPAVTVVDVRQEQARKRGPLLFSDPLRGAVGDALERGEQVLLFLNRRGFSPAYVCGGCGEAVSCPRCSIALTLHRSGEREELLCHYCGHRRRPPAQCPQCAAATLYSAGAGTQMLCEAVERLWPQARTLRLDRDVVRRQGGRQVLSTFYRGEADILVGTQMVAKGHHFPRLTVVGVIDADQALHFPDFRAAERTYQLLTQVAGRAGREERPGRVLVQTRNPHHPAIEAAVEADFDGFARQELALRQEAGFPPFRRLGLLRISAPREEQALDLATAAVQRAEQLVRRCGGDVLGPAPAPLQQVRGRWRYQVLVRAPGPDPGPLQQVLRGLLSSPGVRGGGQARLHADIDPVHLL